VVTSRLLAQCSLAALMASAALLLIGSVVEGRRDPPRRLPLHVMQRTTEVLVLALSALFILASRFPSWSVHTAINPDEAQMTANALLVRAGNWTWSGLDGGTSGPANSIVLAWPYLFGMDATLSTTRVTSTMFLIAILGLTYSALRPALSTRSALLIVLPAILFVGGTVHTDFVHYKGGGLNEIKVFGE
jgi:hypothetical protein